MGANKEKVYTIYVTEDGRMEMKVCYKTNTAWVLSDGKVAVKMEKMTVRAVWSAIEQLMRYDGILAEDK